MRPCGPPWHCPSGLLREGDTGLDHVAQVEAGSGKGSPKGPLHPLTHQEHSRPPPPAVCFSQASSSLARGP